MGNPRKIIACAAALSVTMCSIAAAGCGKKPGSNPTIEADSDWYNVTKVTLESDADLSGTEYSQTKVLGRIGDCYAVLYRGQYPIPYDADWENINYKDYTMVQIDTYDSDGEYICAVDLYDAVISSGLLEEASEEMSIPDPGFDVWDPEVSGDRLVIPVDVYGGPDSHMICYKLFIDPSTGDVSYDRSEADSSLLPGTFSLAEISTIGSYTVREYEAYDEDYVGYSVLQITDGSNETIIDLNEALPEDKISAIVEYLDMGSGKLLCAVVGEQVFGPLQYYEIDTVSGGITKAEDGKYSWFGATDVSNSSYFEDVGNVIMDTHGILKIDFENNEITEILSFDDCNINRSDVSYMDLISCTEDEVIMMGSVYISEAGGDNVQLIRLTKADSNPNAGKTILTAAATGSIGYAMSEAVCIFNETDPDYFIKFDPAYEFDRYVEAEDSDVLSENQYMINTDGAYSRLSDQLTVDIMAGEGPDIIFDSCGLSHLDTDSYLTDMSDWIDTEGLFGNIIDACKTDGKLYQMPLAFGITGIVTKTENVAPGQTGFTFDEYGEFVDTVCNGSDPLSMNQTEFFIRCLAAMDDLCYTEDGRVDYDNEAFRALAEFTSENIFPVQEERSYQDIMVLDNAGGIYYHNGSFVTLLTTLRSGINSASVLGLPSIDGRGPLASVGCSVAVSSQSLEQDGCRRFVETLLSKRVQEYYAYETGYSPINVVAFDSVAEKFVSEYNDSMYIAETTTSPAELAMAGVNTARVDMDAIDAYKEMIGTVSAVETSDVAKDIIIREEIPGYFYGQKDLDEVIPIIEDRVQTFLDERG